MTRSHTPRPNEATDDASRDDAPAGLARRRFLTYLVAAPTLTIAAKIGADTVAPTSAAASVVPQPAEVLDLGDALILAGAPTSNMLRLEVKEDGTVVFELPRSEVGQGITTAFTMLVADEMDVALGDVTVTLADARSRRP